MQWRAAGVVDRGRLEICCTLRGTGGSNPSLSAKKYPLNEFFSGYFFQNTQKREDISVPPCK